MPQVALKPVTLKDAFGSVCRRKHVAVTTERTYWHHILHYARFHRRPPREMGADEIREYLSHLARDRHVSSNTQNQALCALRFLYIEVYQRDVPLIHGIEWAKRSLRVPVVFTKREAERVIDLLTGAKKIQAGLMYGSGLRVGESVSLRVKDLDFESGQITVRAGKGDKDRVVPFPRSLYEPLHAQLRRARLLWENDLREGFGAVQLPHALARKFPDAPRSWGWQFVFPADHLSTDKRTGFKGRWHVFPDGVQRAVKLAIRQAGITKHASCHTFRHTFATQLLEAGYDVRQIQTLMGHNSLNTTMIYLHLTRQGAAGVVSPLDRRPA